MKKNLKEITSKMSRSDIPFVLAQLNSRKLQHLYVKSIVIQILYWTEGLTQCEIASMLHTTQATVSRMMKFHKKTAANNPDYKHSFDEAMKRYEYA